MNVIDWQCISLALWAERQQISVEAEQSHAGVWRQSSTRVQRSAAIGICATTAVGVFGVLPPPANASLTHRFRSPPSAVMKLLYPASHEIPLLSDSILAVKVARHSHCSLCKSCVGLHPPHGVVVVLDGDDDGGGASTSLGGLTGYGSDEEERPDQYLHSCACGHDLYDHGADKTAIGPDEFARRGRVSVRLDEMLEVCANRMHGLRALIQLHPSRLAGAEFEITSLLSVLNDLDGFRMRASYSISGTQTKISFHCESR